MIRLSARKLVTALLTLTFGPVHAAQLTGPDSITMPIFGDHQNITTVWQRTDGHIVFEFFYRKDGRSFVDFFDTRTGKRLFPDRAEEMAHSPGMALQRSLRPKTLTKVEAEHFYSIEGPSGYSAKHGGYEGGSLCGVQYSSPIEITTKDVYRFAIYSRSISPRKFNSPCGGGEVSLNYKEASVRFLSADKYGFWALLPDQSTIARFDWNAKSRFFEGRSDPVLVPYAEMDEVRKHAEDRTPAQKEYEKAERLIQLYSRRQLRAGSK